MDKLDKIDIGKTLSETVSEIFETMLSMDVQIVDDAVGDDLDENRMVGSVNFAGEVIGLLSIHVSDVFSRTITAAMLGMEIDEIEDDEEIKDVIGEVTNIVTGNLKTEFVNANLACVISTPSITTGSDFSIDELKIAKVRRFNFVHQEHTMLVELCVKTEIVEGAKSPKAKKLPAGVILERMQQVDIVAMISESIVDVFDTMLSINIEKTEPDTTTVSEESRVVGSVTFAGDVMGVFKIEVSESFSRIMTASMLGIELDEIESEEEVHDVIREMSNIIGGNLKSGYVDVGLSCELSTPSITKGSDFRIEALNIEALDRFAFKYEDHTIVIDAGVRKDLPGGKISDKEKAPSLTDTPKFPMDAMVGGEFVTEEDEEAALAEALRKKNLEFIMDIPLEVTVELGRTREKINDLLQMRVGSVVKLEQLEGEPVDILVNETLIARGEVMVENEKYGIRIREIVTREERIRSMN